MKRKVWAGLLIVIFALAAGFLLFRSYVPQPSPVGFSLISLKDNAILISDKDILSYNWTSQEITLTNEASQRLRQLGESLYSFSPGFVIKIDGQEVYRGVFRLSTMSAIPELPKISIMYPSVLFPSNFENYSALRMFYPCFQPPAGQAEENSKLSVYFEETNRLTH